MTERDVLEVADVAALLHCADETVREWAPRLGGLKFGRDWVFPAATFHAALNALASAAIEAQRKPARPPSAVLASVGGGRAVRRPPVLP
mgnify:CR=1 FL=1